MEAFPERKVLEETEGNLIDNKKSKAIVTQNEKINYTKNKLNQHNINHRLKSGDTQEISEFAQNLFSLWNKEQTKAIPIQTVIEELMGLGLAIDSKLIKAVIILG